MGQVERRGKVGTKIANALKIAGRAFRILGKFWDFGGVKAPPPCANSVPKMSKLVQYAQKSLQNFKLLSLSNVFKTYALACSV